MLIAKACFAQCSTSRLALGQPVCCLSSSFVTMPNISLKTLCFILEKPRVQEHQNWYSQLSITQIHITITQIQLISARNTKHMLCYAIPRRWPGSVGDSSIAWRPRGNACGGHQGGKQDIQVAYSARHGLVLPFNMITPFPMQLKSHPNKMVPEITINLF